MYGFTGLYGNPYGQQLRLTGRADIPQAQTQQVLQAQRNRSLTWRPSGTYRVTETGSDGCITAYARQADGSWKIASGPRFVGQVIAKGGILDADWQRLEAAYAAKAKDITPAGRPTGRFCDIAESDRPPSESNTEGGEDEVAGATPLSTYLVGGLAIAGIAGGAYYLFFRKKKRGTP